jgi:hypothetical protein
VVAINLKSFHVAMANVTHFGENKRRFLNLFLDYAEKESGPENQTRFNLIIWRKFVS